MHERFAARPLREAAPASREYIVLAVRLESSWQFNPGQDYALRPGHHPIVMATPEGRRTLEQALGG